MLHYSQVVPGANQVPSQGQRASAHLPTFATSVLVAVTTGFCGLRPVGFPLTAGKYGWGDKMDLKGGHPGV